jgi:aarF domain-containing kinase
MKDVSSPGGYGRFHAPQNLTRQASYSQINVSNSTGAMGNRLGPILGRRFLLGASIAGASFAAGSLLVGDGGFRVFVGRKDDCRSLSIERLDASKSSTEDQCAPVASPSAIKLLQRFVSLSLTFLPAILMSPLLLFNHQTYTDYWMVLVKSCLEKAGPAFIKYGQWAATRPDLFSPDVCKTFQELQTDAPRHDFSYTKKIIEEEFGRDAMGELFLSFDTVPIASGSVAQVHRAVLSEKGAFLANRDKTFKKGSVVAVKVRHPGVRDSIELDFELMNFLASQTEKVIRFWNNGKSSLASAQIKESLMQFGAPMREQLDLRSEAKHLESFADNFKWWWARVRFPLPARGMVSEDVLVETFETGDHISDYLNKESEHNHTLANLGLKTYLKMLMMDNLIHADLHPGNILVHLDSPAEGTLLKRISDALKFKFEIPRIVLLDVGMTTRLTEVEQGNLVRFFDNLTSMDGHSIAESILSFAERVDDATGFKVEMRALFEKLEPEQLRRNTQEVIGNMMDTIREHNIQIPGVVSNVIISTVVLEGWSSKLNPNIRILESVKEFLPEVLEERVRSTIERGHGGFSTEQ